MPKLPPKEKQRRISEGLRLYWATRKSKEQSSGYRPEWFVKLAKNRTVLQIALDYHMTNMCSFDRPHTDQEIDKILLKHVVADWRNHGVCDFDDAVLALVEAALQESKSTHASSQA